MDEEYVLQLAISKSSVSLAKMLDFDEVEGDQRKLKMFGVAEFTFTPGACGPNGHQVLQEGSIRLANGPKIDLSGTLYLPESKSELKSASKAESTPDLGYKKKLGAIDEMTSQKRHFVKIFQNLPEMFNRATNTELSEQNSALRDSLVSRSESDSLVSEESCTEEE